MQNDRLQAIITGVLFIIGTAAGVLSVILSGPVLNAPDYLARAAASAGQIRLAALLIFTMGAACAGTAIAMYPILKRYNPALAIGAAGFRLMEGVFAILGFVLLLSLMSLARESAATGNTDVAYYYQISGTVLMAGQRWAFTAGLFCWCLAALMYYYLFYQTKLIPKWLSVWGLIGIIMALTANFLDLFDLFDSFSPVNSALNFPIAVQEMVMAVYLIVKGFKVTSAEAAY